MYTISVSFKTLLLVTPKVCADTTAPPAAVLIGKGLISKDDNESTTTIKAADILFLKFIKAPFHPNMGFLWPAYLLRDYTLPFYTAGCKTGHKKLLTKDKNHQNWN